MKKFLLILSLIVCTSFLSNAQNRIQGGPGAGASIVLFYPNPATTVVNFDFQKNYDKGYSIQIFNFLGRKMYEATNIPPKTTLNLTDYGRGVYIYQLRDKTGKLVESGKFQVSK